MTHDENTSTLFETTLEPGAGWSHVLKRGTALRITDLTGGANVSAMFYNADLLVERYNMPDTLKGQHTFFLTRGHVLYSDMGRVLVSIIEDSFGWHDTVTGHSTAESVRACFGESRYQDARNEFHRNARDVFICELEKVGLDSRDLMANVNFFSKVTCGERGDLRLDAERSTAGDSVTLRAEMNTLVALTSCPHPMASEGSYPRTPVRLSILRTALPSADDTCRTSCPQNERAFVNTERYWL